MRWLAGDFFAEAMATPESIHSRHSRESGNPFFF